MAEPHAHVHVRVEHAALQDIISWLCTSPIQLLCTAERVVDQGVHYSRVQKQTYEGGGAGAGLVCQSASASADGVKHEHAADAGRTAAYQPPRM